MMLGFILFIYFFDIEISVFDEVTLYFKQEQRITAIFRLTFLGN